MTKITKEIFEQALKGTGGVHVAIAQNMNVQYKTLWKYLKKHPEAEELRLMERKKQVGKAELVIYKEVERGNLKAAQFVAERLGKNEGWAQKTETDINATVNSKEEIKKILLGGT